jgi:DNA-binding beta-propeller fold protein YncE
LRDQNAIAIVDGNSLQIRATLPVCNGPNDIAVLPDSSKAFIACSGSGEVAAVQLKNAARNQQQDAVLALLQVGKTPTSLVLKPDGGEVFTTNFDSESISEVATNTNEVGGSYSIGAGPVRGVIASDNATMFVSNFKADTIAVYDITVSKLLGTVQTGSGPDAIALSSGGRYLYVANSGSGDLTIINAVARTSKANPSDRLGRKILAVVPVGSKPSAIAVKAFIQE